MIRRPPRSTRTDTLVPYTTLFRSATASDDARLAHGGRSAPNEGPVFCRHRRAAVDPRLFGADRRRRSAGADGCTLDRRAAGRKKSAPRLRIQPPKSRRDRTEGHPSAPPSLMRISSAVFRLKKKKQNNQKPPHNITRPN